jgi:hypothetical protein
MARTRQPQGAAALSRYFAENASVVYCPSLGARNLVNGKALTVGSTPPTLTPTKDGLGSKWDTSTHLSHVVLGNANELYSSTSATLLLLRNFWGIASESAEFGFNVSTSERFLCHAPWSDGNLYFDPSNASTNRVTVSGQTWTAGKTDALAFGSSTTGRGTEVWRDGKLIGSGAATTLDMEAQPFYFGGMPKGSEVEINLNPTQSSGLLIALFPRELPQELIRDWSANPWGVTFAPQRRLWIQLGAAAGGGVDADVAGTQATDVGAIAVEATTGAALAGTQATDVGAITVEATTGAAIAGTQAGDVGAITAEATTGADIAGVQASDRAAVEVTASTGETEAVIAGAQASDVGAVDVEATLGLSIAGTQASDLGYIVVEATLPATMAGTQMSDVAAIAVLGTSIWTDVGVSAATWTDVGGASSIWTDV